VLKACWRRRRGSDPALIGDVIVGCAIPEAEQGINVARVGVLLAGLPQSVPGMTINRFCSSGLQAVALAADRIRLGEADVMIAAGTETMSLMPQMMGNKISINPAVFEKQENYGIAYGMGLTAENVAQQWKVSARGPGCLRAGQPPEGDGGRGRRQIQGEITPFLVRSHLPAADGTVRIVDRLVEKTKGRARIPASKASPSCGRCSPAPARSPPATVRRCRTGAGAVLVVERKGAAAVRPQAHRALRRLRGAGWRRR